MTLWHKIGTNPTQQSKLHPTHANNTLYTHPVLVQIPNVSRNGYFAHCLLSVSLCHPGIVVRVLLILPLLCSQSLESGIAGAGQEADNSSTNPQPRVKQLAINTLGI